MLKEVCFVLVRHGKSVPELVKTLSASELARARRMGDGIFDADIVQIDAVVYSPLPRAIQTAFALQMGHNASNPVLLPAIPAFGTDALFAEMAAPDNFRNLASELGIFEAVLRIHPDAKIQMWMGNFMAAFDKLFDEAEENGTILAVLHSPVIEMLLLALTRREGWELGERLGRFEELDAVAFKAVKIEGESVDEPMCISDLRKIPAPAE